MELMAGYKQTEVGAIPEDWDLHTLDSLATMVASGRSSAGASIGDYPVHGSTGIIGYTSHPEYEGDAILVARVGANAGRLNFVSGKYGVTDNTIILRLRSNYFLPYFWRQLEAIRLNTLVFGSGQPLITGTQIKALSIPVPTLPEQLAVATTLSDVDALLGRLDCLIAKKRDLKQAAMHQLLTGQTRLPGFSGEWETCELRKFVKNFIVPMRDKPKRLTGDIPWCRIEDFNGMYLAESKSEQFVDAETIRHMNLKVFPVGTLLVSCSADLGRCAIVSRPLVSNQTFIGLEFDEKVASNLFFYYLMTSKSGELNKLSSGTTISYLSREQFEEFLVFTPIEKTEQAAIARVLTDIDTDLSTLELQRFKTAALKQGMMQELLTGRTRLVPSKEVA